MAARDLEQYRKDAGIVILEDDEERRAQQARLLQACGFDRVAAYPAQPSFLLQHRAGPRGRAVDVVLFGLTPEQASSWAQLQGVHEAFAGPILALVPDGQEPAAARLEELGVFGTLRWHPGREEHLAVKLDGLLAAEQVQRLVRESDQRTQKMFINILLVIVKLLESKDYYTRFHSHAVAVWSRTLGRKCGLNEDQLQRVGLAGMLHDFGKIGIPETILNKPSQLTDEEFERIKQHPAIARDLLAPIELLSDLLPAIMHHHERWDGRGYPAGLKGEGIPVWSRIIGIADAFDTMLGRRVYKEPYPLERVVEELRKGRGTQFDPALADHMIQISTERALPAERRGPAAPDAAR